MLVKYRFWIVCAALALLLIFALMFLEWMAVRDTPQILASYLLRDDGERRAITLPFSEQGTGYRVVYEYVVEIDWSEGANARFRVIPDDYLESITVNGQLMSEERYSGSGRGDWNNGLIVDFGTCFHNGKNEILFRITDNGGKYGMAFNDVGLHLSPLRVAALTLCIVLVLALVSLILRRFKIDSILIIFILLALVWQFVSLAVRDHKRYAYDLYEGNKGHVNYIHYIADNGTLPPPRGWSYYHPPLYYTIAAGVWMLAKSLDISDPFKVLQVLSLIFYWIFLVYSLRLLAQFIRQPWVYRLAAALILFWPAGFLAAIRIGNDALLYPLFMMALFHGHKWFVGENRRDLLLASVFCGLGFFVKISILPLGIILGCLVLWRLFQKRTALPLRYALASIGILTVCFFLPVLNKWVYEAKADNPKWYITPFSNAFHMNSKLYVQNKAVDILFPDTKCWFKEEYINSWEGTIGRENLWTYVGKTAMYGEWFFRDTLREKYLAPFMNANFALLFILMCYGFPMLWRSRRIPYTLLSGVPPGISPCNNNILRGRMRNIGRWLGAFRANSKYSDFRFVLAVAIHLLALVVVTRIVNSTPTQTDFRYILPLMPVMVAAMAAGLMRLADARMRTRRWLFIFGNALVICFVFVSLIFYFGI